MNQLSLFTGYAGFDLGLRIAGLQTRTVMYVEWERYPQEIIKARIKDGFLDDAPIWGDISTLDGWQLRGVVDLITAGFPCQPHSVAGLKQGIDDERNLWPETLRVIREVEPRYVLLENVPGILSASADGGTPAYGGTVVGELASLGYSVHWQTIGADDVGAPHRRKRWWCIGVAYSSSGRHGEPQEEIRTGGDTTEHGVGNMAYSEGERYRGGSSSERGDEGRFVQPEEQGRSEVGSEAARRNRELAHSGSVQRPQVRADVADSNNEGLEGIGANGHQAGWQEPNVSLGLPSGAIPVWPPSPTDADEWGRVLRERPDLAPALTKEAESQFRGVDDGRSHRVDELKALGNGIVPSVVAEFLWRTIGKE